MFSRQPWKTLGPRHGFGFWFGFFVSGFVFGLRRFLGLDSRFSRNYILGFQCNTMQSKYWFAIIVCLALLLCELINATNGQITSTAGRMCYVFIPCWISPLSTPLKCKSLCHNINITFMSHLLCAHYVNGRWMGSGVSINQQMTHTAGGIDHTAPHPHPLLVAFLCLAHICRPIALLNAQISGNYATIILADCSWKSRFGLQIPGVLASFAISSETANGSIFRGNRNHWTITFIGQCPW